MYETQGYKIPLFILYPQTRPRLQWQIIFRGNNSVLVRRNKSVFCECNMLRMQEGGYCLFAWLSIWDFLHSKSWQPEGQMTFLSHTNARGLYLGDKKMLFWVSKKQIKLSIVTKHNNLQNYSILSPREIIKNIPVLMTYCKIAGVEMSIPLSIIWSTFTAPIPPYFRWIFQKRNHGTRREIGKASTWQLQQDTFLLLLHTQELLARKNWWRKPC